MWSPRHVLQASLIPDTARLVTKECLSVWWGFFYDSSSFSSSITRSRSKHCNYCILPKEYLLSDWLSLDTVATNSSFFEPRPIDPTWHSPLAFLSWFGVFWFLRSWWCHHPACFSAHGSLNAPLCGGEFMALHAFLACLTCGRRWVIALWPTFESPSIYKCICVMFPQLQALRAISEQQKEGGDSEGNCLPTCPPINDTRVSQLRSHPCHSWITHPNLAWYIIPSPAQRSLLLRLKSENLALAFATASV